MRVDSCHKDNRVLTNITVRVVTSSLLARLETETLQSVAVRQSTGNDIVATISIINFYDRP